MSARPAHRDERPIPPELARLIEALARAREERDYRARQAAQEGQTK